MVANDLHGTIERKLMGHDRCTASKTLERKDNMRENHDDRKYDFLHKVREITAVSWHLFRKAMAEPSSIEHRVLAVSCCRWTRAQGKRPCPGSESKTLPEICESPPRSICPQSQCIRSDASENIVTKRVLR